MPDRRVIIVGAGLGGLCLAQGLHKAGVRVAVYERDQTPVARFQGYRLHINSDGGAALRAALPNRLFQLFVATAGIPAPRSVVYDEQLNEVWSYEQGRPYDGVGIPEHLAVNRHTVRQILLSGLDDVVSFGKEFVRYEIGDQITAHFADGSAATGDVLVAADGVNSAVRKQYLPYARIVDTGVRQLYGKIPLNSETRDLFLDGMFTIFTPIVGPDRKYVGVAPVERRESIQRAVDRVAPEVRLDPNADYMSFGFGGRLEVLPCSDDELRAMTGPELLAMALDQLHGWHPRVRRIAEHCDPETLFPLVLRTSVPIPRWRTTAVTLLGDAIHAMSPAGGVGANTALRDAGNLLNALTSDEPALEQYEAAMTDYGFAAVRESAVNGQRTLAQNPLPVE